MRCSFCSLFLFSHELVTSLARKVTKRSFLPNVFTLSQVSSELNPSLDSQEIGTKTKYTFNCNSFKRFTSVDDIYRNLVYFTLPGTLIHFILRKSVGPLVYLEPFELVCKLTLASITTEFRSLEFYQEAFEELHKVRNCLCTLCIF